MDTVLVTGGAGFIGSNLSNRLLDNGQRVYVIDNLSTGEKKFLKKGVDFIKNDVTSNRIQHVIKKIKPKYIVHLAALANVSQSFKDPQKNFTENLIPIVNLTEVAKDLQINKFVFASTAAVFGNATGFPLLETTPKEPVSPYGISKLCSEYYLSFAGQKFNFPAVTLRFANVYGENQSSNEEGGVVSIFTSAAIKGRAVTIFGNGNQTRDFIYVGDVVDAILASLDSTISTDFNVGTSKETTINELAALIFQMVGNQPRIIYNKNHEHGISRNSMSYEKIDKHLSWKPKTSLNDGIKKTVDFFKSSKL